MTPTLSRLRWWHLPAVLALERELFEADAWSERLFWSELAQTDTRHYLVALDPEAPDGLVGYAGLCVYPDEAFVQTIAVRPEHQGAGVGGALLLALLHEAAGRGVDVVGLEVRADNGRAQRLYERLGFAPVGMRRGYYQPSGADAVVMMLSGLRARLAAPA
ncbi:MAG: ribosomal protein S18-alanine N-acetyltransferase [Actinomycetota bacterium]|nr:ribosomal protein S18-alanine N-acetyltransferase [Actinomycetota bacterium]